MIGTCSLAVLPHVGLAPSSPDLIRHHCYVTHTVTRHIIPTSRSSSTLLQCRQRVLSNSFFVFIQDCCAHSFPLRFRVPVGCLTCTAVQENWSLAGQPRSVRGGASGWWTQASQARSGCWYGTETRVVSAVPCKAQHLVGERERDTHSSRVADARDSWTGRWG